jgi:DNA-binding response OmpR family regulator
MGNFSVQYGLGRGRIGSRMDCENEIVYIVDDDPIVRDGLSSLLRANGKNVRLFTSGTEFLSCQRDDLAACLILDLKMPGMSGLEVQTVISAQISIPIVFITGRGDIPSTVKAMKGGAVDFLTKPVDEAVLLAAVEQALQKDRIARREAPGTGGSPCALPFAYASRARVAAAVGGGPVEQAGGSGTWNHRVHGSNSSRQHHAQDEGRLIRDVSQAGDEAES